ncbi:MAG TPA: FAD-dependent oxidoreductase [Microlunatus sp.]|nr:FAD-dependent oxidoreductase [Microlunatus sp.]
MSSTSARIAVIGTGVLGSAVAAELAVRGAAVTILDAARPGSGTSGTSFAWVSSGSKEPVGYHELNVAAIEAHHRAAVAGDDAFVRSGRLSVATGPAQVAGLVDRVQRLADRGYPAELVTVRRARELEPALLLPDAATVGWFPSEGYCRTDRFIDRRLRIAAAHGARQRYGEPVRAVRDGTVQLDSGSERYDRVVLAVGRWTEPLAATAGITVPMVPGTAGGPAVGYLAETAPAVAGPGRVVLGPDLHLRPTGSGGLVLQALDLDASADPDAGPPPRIGTGFAARLAGLLREAPPVVRVRVGRRSLPADGLPVAGFAGRDGRVYLLACHSGVTLAPLLGRLVADELLDRASPLLQPYRPERFARP